MLYVFALVNAAGFLKRPFRPSYASFTFPLVISAIAAKQTMARLANMGRPLPVLQYAVLLETIIAVIFVVRADPVLKAIFVKAQVDNPAKKS